MQQTLIVDQTINEKLLKVLWNVFLKFKNLEKIENNIQKQFTMIDVGLLIHILGKTLLFSIISLDI